MFYRYEIKNNGVEDILYLFLTMNYEFSKELGSSSNDSELRRRTNNFIKNNNIDFQGDKVYLVIDNVIVKAFQISKDQKVDSLPNKKSYDDMEYMVTVQLDDSSIVEICLCDYLLGALATNMVPNLSIEVLKAMAILYRTYAFKEMSEYSVIKATNEFFSYRPIEYYKIAFAPNYEEVVSTLKEAIKQTNSMFASYQNQYILPFIHICNHGRTLEDSRYPYLSSVSSLWDSSSPFYVDTDTFSYSFLSQVFHFTISKDTPFQMLEVSLHGKVLKLKIGNSIIDGKRFMNLLHLKSQFLSIIINSQSINVITHGWGDALGLSLYGALKLAENGCSYANILNYYFPKVTICEYIKELSS